MSDTKSSWLIPESEWTQRIFEQSIERARKLLAEKKTKRYVPAPMIRRPFIGPPPTVPAGYRDDSREDYYAAMDHSDRFRGIQGEDLP